MKTISAVVITFNEEINIRECLESLSAADEIIVVDSRSQDRTVEIAREYTDKVTIVDWPGFSKAKNHGVDLASHDWILSLDADERVSRQLNEALLQFKKKTSSENGYRIARRTWYLSRWIRGGGWYPDRTIRLFNRNSGRFSQVPVHESVQLTGECGELSGDILHYSYRDLGDHLQRINRYSGLCAEKWFESGRTFSPLSMIIRPPLEFIRKLVLKRGFVDGIEGLIVAGMHSIYVFLKYAKLYELELKRKRRNKS